MTTFTWGECGHPLRTKQVTEDGRIVTGSPYCHVCWTATLTTEAQNARSLRDVSPPPMTVRVTSVTPSNTVSINFDDAVDFMDVTGFVEGMAVDFSSGPTRGDIRKEWRGREDEANAWSDGGAFNGGPLSQKDLEDALARRRGEDKMDITAWPDWTHAAIQWCIEHTRSGPLPHGSVAGAGRYYDPVSGEPFAEYMAGIDAPEGYEVIGAGPFANSFVRVWRDVGGEEVTYRRSIAEPSAPLFSDDLTVTEFPAHVTSRASGKAVEALEAMGIDTSTHGAPS